MAGYAANSAVNTPQVTPERSMNNPGSYNNESYNSFDKSHLRFYTQRFSEVYPCLSQPANSGDNIPLSVRHELRNYTLKAPLLSSLKMYRSFYQIPLSAISPYTWELQLRQPIRGQDIAFGDVAQRISLSRVLSLYSRLLFHLHDTTQLTTIGEAFNYSHTLLRSTLFLSLFLGNSSLLSALGVALPYRKEADDIYSSVMDTFLNLMTSIKTSSGLPYISNLSYRDNDGNTHTLSATRQEDDSNIFHISLSLSEMWNFIRDALQFGNISIGFSTLKDEDYASLYSSLSAPVLLAWNIFNPSNVENVQYADFLAQIKDTDADYISLRPVIAYQMACAQFFSNTAIDDIYTAKQWLLDSRSYESSFPGVKNRAESFSLNGAIYLYDAFAGKRVSEMLDSFKGSVTTLASAVSTSISILKYFENLFGIRQSLRYPDYFTSSRTQPLAVGDVTTTVNENKVSAININQSLWMQRFLNAVNRTSQNIYEYLKSMDGVEPQRKVPQPYFLASEEFNISGQEVENTADNQGAVTTLLRSENSSFAFKAFIDEPSYVIGVTYFNALSVYDSLRPLHWEQNDRFDWFNSYMQHIGDQPVYLRELLSDRLNKSEAFGYQFANGIFGYQLRYAQYKFENSIALGGFINGSLPGWSLICKPFGRAGSISFAKSPTISEQFIRNDDYAFDELYSSLTGTNPATRFHFVIAQYANEVVNSKQQKFPSLL